MELATPHHTCPATNLSADAKKAIAMFILSAETTITNISKQYDVSRKFLHGIKDKAIAAVKQAFHKKERDDDKVLFTISVTKTWIEQLVLSMQLHGKASFRGVINILDDVFDYKISIAKINNIVMAAKSRAKKINNSQDLSEVKLGAHDEMFHNNKPILAGVDIRSLYCYLLSQEDHRDGDTWAITLMNLQEQGFNPERVIADQGEGLRAGHAIAMSDVPCDGDNFHIILKMTKMRIYFGNKLKSAKSYHNKLEERIKKAEKKGKKTTATDLIYDSKKHYDRVLFLYRNISTLVNWMRRDVLEKAGPCPLTRHELYDFIVDELQKLAEIHPHRIKDVCTSLKNQKNDLLAFADVLNDKLIKISDNFNCPLSTVWEICNMQKYKEGSDKYVIKSFPLILQFDQLFYEIEDHVIEALNTTERTSSMIENLNSRLRPFLFLRRQIGNDYLELLRFYLNHKPFMRSESHRKDKTPAQMLTGKEHLNWLEMLGYKRFKQAA